MQHVMPQSISPDLIDHGKVNKYVIYQDKTHEISLLELSPGAKIKCHTHKNDSEIYFHVNNKTLSLCKKDEEHSLENVYDEPLQIISIKYF